MKRALPLLAVAAVLGCGGAAAVFNRTGPTLPAQADGCDFTVLHATPSEPHTELGTIAIKYESQMDWINDEAAFKRKIRPLVCQTGGDSAIAHVNNNGLYIKATVISTKPIATASTASAPAEEPETTPAAPPAAAPTASASAAPPAAAAAPATPSAAKASSGASSTSSAAPAEKVETPKESKGRKKGQSAKKDDDIRDKNGKIDIDKLL